MIIKQRLSYSLFCCLIFFIGCANIQSGKYVKLNKKDDLASISKRYKIPKWQLAIANKEKGFQSGEWIFVPQAVGFMGNDKTRSVASLPRQLDQQFLWPVPASKKISSVFGKRRGKRHHGIDIPARRGTAILAVDDGIVAYSGRDLAGYGNLTVIAHKHGLFSVYAHAKKNLTSRGERVDRGQVIAQVGTTGRSTGPHLHFEIRFQGQSIDPLRVVSL